MSVWICMCLSTASPFDGFLHLEFSSAMSASHDSACWLSTLCSELSSLLWSSSGCWKKGNSAVRFSVRVSWSLWGKGDTPRIWFTAAAWERSSGRDTNISGTITGSQRKCSHTLHLLQDTRLFFWRMSPLQDASDNPVVDVQHIKLRGLVRHLRWKTQCSEGTFSQILCLLQICYCILE